MNFYEVKVNYRKQTGEDNPANVRESYLVEGANCSDVEKRTIEYIEPYVMGGLETPQIKQRKLFEIIPNNEGEKWYDAKVEIITIEDMGEEKRRAVNILICAIDLVDAVLSLDKALGEYNCELVCIKRSAIVEVLRLQKA